MSTADTTPSSSGAVDPEGRAELVLDRLQTGRHGLTSREAARRLTQDGPNEIRREVPRSRVRELAGQLVDPLALLLWVAAAFAVAEGAFAVAITIVAVILLNALFAFAQEMQAERATEALKHYLPDRARVRRDGKVVEGAGFATRTARASLRQIGLFTNHLLLWGIAFEIVFAAAIIWRPPLQSVFHTTGLPVTDVLVLVAMAPIVWGVDELRRWHIRSRRSAERSGPS